MNFASDPAWASGVATGPKAAGERRQRHWLIAGAAPVALEQMALTLSHFGIDAQPWLGNADAARHRLVLCAVRHRAEVQPWIAELPRRSAPILFIGQSSAGARARLIAAGAADALSARISPRELVARLAAAERLHAAQQGLVHLAGLDFDMGLRQLWWQGRAIPLMPREFDLLLMLARQAGVPISREDLLLAVWRTPFDPGTNSVEVYICKLRRSLGALREAVRIETVRYRGYRLISEPVSGG